MPRRYKMIGYKKTKVVYDEESKVNEIPKYQIPKWSTDNKQYPSYNGGIDPIGIGTSRKQNEQYTGKYIIGIATMHKSNLMPVSKAIKTNPKLQ